jgi:hypothetical protein
MARRDKQNVEIDCIIGLGVLGPPFCTIMESKMDNRYDTHFAVMLLRICKAHYEVAKDRDQSEGENRYRTLIEI